jgi:hypothetical protein
MIQNTDNYVKSWRCWYNDNSETITEYNSIDHNLVDLPNDGFQAMRLWYHNGYGRFISGHDFYFFAEHPSGTIFGGSGYSDTPESITNRYDSVSIKSGKHTTDGIMIEINDLMISSVSPS